MHRRLILSSGSVQSLSLFRSRLCSSATVLPPPLLLLLPVSASAQQLASEQSSSLEVALVTPMNVTSTRMKSHLHHGKQHSSSQRELRRRERSSEKYCDIVNDPAWRGSTFHMIFGCGSAYIDIKCGNPVTGENSTTSNMSFDGEGCLSSCQLSFPDELAAECLQLVPNKKDAYEVPAESPLAAKIENFFKLKIAGKEVPDDWVDAFSENGVISKSNE